MKLYVEEQDMPPNCAECKAEGHYENSYGDEYGFFCPFGYKAYTSGTRDTKRLDNCPLVPIPPHGRLVVLDRETALAIAAGCKAIRTTKRLIGASYVYDPFGENGGPYEIPYVKAGDILRKIWDEYPLDSENAEEGE